MGEREKWNKWKKKKSKISITHVYTNVTFSSISIVTRLLSGQPSGINFNLSHIKSCFTSLMIYIAYVQSGKTKLIKTKPIKRKQSEFGNIKYIE